MGTHLSNLNVVDFELGVSMDLSRVQEVLNQDRAKRVLSTLSLESYQTSSFLDA